MGTPPRAGSAPAITIRALGLRRLARSNLPLLNILNFQCRQFRAPQTAAQKNCECGVVSLSAKTANVYGPQKALTLLCGKPIANRHTQPFTRRIPAARSALKSRQSAASYASLLTAASRKLMVVEP